MSGGLFSPGRVVRCMTTAAGSAPGLGAQPGRGRARRCPAAGEPILRTSSVAGRPSASPSPAARPPDGAASPCTGLGHGRPSGAVGGAADREPTQEGRAAVPGAGAEACPPSSCGARIHVGRPRMGRSYTGQDVAPRMHPVPPVHSIRADLCVSGPMGSPLSQDRSAAGTAGGIFLALRGACRVGVATNRRGGSACI